MTVAELMKALATQPQDAKVLPCGGEDWGALRVVIADYLGQVYYWEGELPTSDGGED